MSHIHTKDTGPELTVRSFLHRAKFRFRLHVKGLPGTPDIVLPKYKTVIEVRGCFWHRHPGCPAATTPSTNVDFWKEKFEKNVARDWKTETELRRLGWKLIVVWECDLKKTGFLDSLPEKIHSKFQTQTSKLPAKDTCTNDVTPENACQKLHELVSTMTSEQLKEAAEIMVRFIALKNSAEYKVFVANHEHTPDDVDDYMFEKILGKEKALENAARKKWLHENAGKKK